jgi:FkbM family methyltransferase
VLDPIRGRLARRIVRLALLAQAAGQHRSSLDLRGTVSVDTPYGRLYAHEHDDWITPVLAQQSVWEPGETAFLESRLRRGMTFLDIGAHVGYFSVLAARLVGPRGLVLAFEPDPRNFELLLANVWRNELANVVCFPWAVGAASSFADLYLSETNTGDHRIFPAAEERPRITVRSVALDSLDVLRPPVGMIKIDTQGAEHLAVRGMERLLAASPRIVMTVEFWPMGIRLAGDDATSVLAYYRSLGLEIRVQHPDEVGTLELDDAEILRYCAGKEGEAFTNLILSRA